MKQLCLITFIFVLMSGLIARNADLLAQSDAGAVGEQKEKEDVLQKRYKNFKERLSGTKLTGKFTVASQPDQDLTAESYEILKVEKMDEGDYWRITARIKYGKNDVTVPLAIQVKWAGNTPVMTVDSLFVPGLGTFDARVVFRKNKYAGTWAHGDVGGHLFGTFEKLTQSTTEDE